MIKASTTPTGFIRIYFDENLIYSEVQASGGSRTAATSKMERFVIIVNITKRSILDVAAALDPHLD